MGNQNNQNSRYNINIECILKEQGLITITTYRNELGHTRNIYKTNEPERKSLSKGG